MRFLTLLICLICVGICSAQDTLHVGSVVPRNAIKFSPLHLLNFYPTIELSYERMIFRKTTLQLEGGYILNYRSGDPDFQNKRGVKLKLEGRYYFFERTDRQKLYYASVEPYWNAVNFDRASSKIECFDADCNSVYRRHYRYKMEYREHGFSLKLGYVKYFSKFCFDISSGWTLRAVRYNAPFEDDDFGFEDDSLPFFDIPNETDRVTFSPAVGLRIGYRFN